MGGAGECSEKPAEDPTVDEGVGDLARSIVLADSEKERVRYDVPAWVAGIGVETPRALASFASRWGVRGDFGDRQDGERAAVGERADGVVRLCWRALVGMMNVGVRKMRA